MGTRRLLVLVGIIMAPLTANAQTATAPFQATEEAAAQRAQFSVTLQEGMNTHAQATFGNAAWPGPPPTTPLEIDPARAVTLSGQATGPDGFREFVNIAINPMGSGSTTNFFRDGAISTRSRDSPSGIDLLVGLIAGGQARYGTLSSASFTQASRMDLGGGYVLELTPSIRRRTPEETATRRSQLESQITRLPDNQIRLVDSPAQPAGPPVVLSPLTNSVIRAGDPRATGQ